MYINFIFEQFLKTIQDLLRCFFEKVSFIS